MCHAHTHQSAKFRSRARLGALGLSILLCAASAEAELVLCDGVWTNESCEGILEKQVGGTKELSSEEQEAVQERSAKSSLLHEATMRAIEAKREYGVDLSPERAQEVCRAKESSVEDCRERVEEFTEKLDIRVARKVRIAREKREAERARDVTPPPTQTTVIIDERPVYIVPRRHKYPHGHHGSHHGQHGSAGIKVHTSTGNTSLEVGVSGSVHSGTSQHVDTIGQAVEYHQSQGSGAVSKQTQPSGSTFEQRTLRQPFSANRMRSIR